MTEQHKTVMPFLTHFELLKLIDWHMIYIGTIPYERHRRQCTHLLEWFDRQPMRMELFSNWWFTDSQIINGGTVPSDPVCRPHSLDRHGIRKIRCRILVHLVWRSRMLPIDRTVDRVHCCGPVERFAPELVPCEMCNCYLTMWLCRCGLSFLKLKNVIKRGSQRNNNTKLANVIFVLLLQLNSTHLSGVE